MGRMGTQGMERVKEYIIGEGEGSVGRMRTQGMERVKEYIIGEGGDGREGGARKVG